jgi:hypothetical protein
MVVCYLPFGTTWLPSRHRHFAWTPSDQEGPPLLMPAVQQRRDFVEKEGVEVAHMGEALAGQDYSEQWASPALNHG